MKLRGGPRHPSARLERRAHRPARHKAQESGARTMRAIPAACSLLRRSDGAHGRSGNDGLAGRAFAPGGPGRVLCNSKPRWMSRPSRDPQGMKAQVAIDGGNSRALRAQSRRLFLPPTRQATAFD